MNINPKILSIPPFISTSWKNIASLHVEERPSMHILVVTLHSGARIEVPNLEPLTVEAIFSAHSHFLELEEKAASSKAPPRNPPHFAGGGEQIFSLALPFKNGITDMEGFGTMLQHNPEQADSPDLPGDVLNKITQISKSMGIDDPHAVPKPEPHCNCIRCQIAKAMQAGVSEEEKGAADALEEIVSDEELQFRTWDIAQTGDNLYRVTNPIDQEEHYNVFLGDPIGCTCGQASCEHIKAVLNT